MATTLVELWRGNPAFFDQKTCAQIVSMAGTGDLRDGSSTSQQFREFLKQIPAAQLSVLGGECLTNKFTCSGFALQDVVNEIGSRLGFIVEFGRYRGNQNQVGFDGIWKSPDDFALLVEVKTTDAYRINLDTIANYRNELVQNSRLSDGKSSILLVVGRQDTGDLEAQIRGSRHAWDVRVISLDALQRLVNIKEQLSDWDTSQQINLVLRPFEYTRLDPIVDLIFYTAKDIEDPNANQPEAPDGELAESIQNVQGGFDHETAKRIAIQKAESHLGVSFQKKGRVFWSTSDSLVNLVCLSSQPYSEGSMTHYWYGFKAGQPRFLDQAQRAFVLFVCGVDSPPVLVPWENMKSIVETLKTTPANPTPDNPLVHYHVVIYHYGQRAELLTPLRDSRTDVSKFLLR